MWRTMLTAGILSAALFLSGCSASLLNVTIPEDGYTLRKDIPYGEGPRRTLDLYLPNSTSKRAEKLPLIVYFYGGSWKSGRKEIYKFLAQPFADRGYAVAVPDYRLYPEVEFPAFVRDNAEAVAHLLANAAEYGIDPERVHFMGHSAGAHTAALLVLDRGYLDGAGLADFTPSSFVGLAGPYSFNPLNYESVKAVFENTDPISKARPIKHVRGDIPPTLLLHGTGDETVFPRNTEYLAAALEEAGAPVEAKFYDGIGHIRIVATVAWPLRWLGPPTFEDALSWFETHERAKPAPALADGGSEPAGDPGEPEEPEKPDAAQ